MVSRHKRKSRPTREERTAQVLKGVDVSAADPALILRQIMCDTSAPASARASAARTVWQMEQVTARAVEIANERVPGRAETIQEDDLADGDKDAGDIHQRTLAWLASRKTAN